MTCRGLETLLKKMSSTRVGTNEILGVFYVSQSYFALPRQSIRINSNRLTLFGRTVRSVQSMCYDIGAYDILYSEFKEKCQKPWSE